MTLTHALQTLKTSLATQLPGWTINIDEIDYPKDKLVDIIYGTGQLQYVDLGTRAYVGTLSFYLYRSYKQSYTELLNAVDTVTAWLDDFNDPALSIGGNTEVIANIGTLEGAVDNSTQFRVVELAVPYELLV